MTFPIEHNGEHVLLVWDTHKAYKAMGDQLFPVPAGSLVTICGWCKQNSWAATVLKHEGYLLSHGICRECAKEQTERLAVKPANNKPAEAAETPATQGNVT